MGKVKIQNKLKNKNDLNKPINTTKTMRSLIKRYFTDELYIELLKITLMNTDNNTKCNFVTAKLMDYGVPIEPLGCGTNRAAWLIDGYAVKIALDSDGINTMVPLLSDK